MMSPSTNMTSFSKITPTTTIMDLPYDCLTLILNSINCTAADEKAVALTCHKWLQIQNMNRHSLCLHKTGQQLDFGPAQLHRLLSRFPNLTLLSLSGCTELNDSSLKAIQHRVSGLRSLRLDSCSGITDDGISVFTSGCSALKYVSLYNCNVTDSGLERLSVHCPDLEDINLSHCQLITDSGVNKLVKNCPKLHGVRVPSCWGVKGTGFDGCSQSLASIEAYSCDLTRNGLKGIVSGGGLEYLDISNQAYASCFTVIGEGYGRSLNILNMRFCIRVGDESIKAIAKGCPLLQEWNLALCNEIELLGWESIGENCGSLVKLAVYRCRNICDDGVMALRNGCKSLKVLYISGCSRVSVNMIESFRKARGDVEISGDEVVSFGPS